MFFTVAPPLEPGRTLNKHYPYPLTQSCATIHSVFLQCIFKALGEPHVMCDVFAGVCPSIATAASFCSPECTRLVGSSQEALINKIYSTPTRCTQEPFLDLPHLSKSEKGLSHSSRTKPQRHIGGR